MSVCSDWGDTFVMEHLLPAMLHRLPQPWKRMENNLVTEKSWKMVQKIVGKGKYSEKVMDKSWNFSVAYHKSRTISSDNSIFIGSLQ